MGDFLGKEKVDNSKSWKLEVIKEHLIRLGSSFLLRGRYLVIGGQRFNYLPAKQCGQKEQGYTAKEIRISAFAKYSALRELLDGGMYRRWQEL